jgi:hypothetical protein
VAAALQEQNAVPLLAYVIKRELPLLHAGAHPGRCQQRGAAITSRQQDSIPAG